MSTTFYSVNLTPSAATPLQPQDGQTTTGSASLPPITVVVSREAMAQLDKVEEAALALNEQRNALGVLNMKLGQVETHLDDLCAQYPGLNALIEPPATISSLLATPGGLDKLTVKDGDKLRSATASELNQLGTDLAKINLDTKDLKGQLDALRAKVDRLSLDLAALGAKIASPDGKTEQQRLALNATAKSMIDKQAELQSLLAEPTKNATRIATLQDDIKRLTETYTTQYTELFNVAPKPETVPGASADAAYLKSSKGAYLHKLQVERAEIEESLRLLGKLPSSSDKARQIAAFSSRKGAILIMMTALEKGGYYELRMERQKLSEQMLLEKNGAKLAGLQSRYAEISTYISAVDNAVANTAVNTQRPDGGAPSRPSDPGGTPLPASELPWPVWLGNRPVEPTNVPLELEKIAEYKTLQADFAAAAVMRKAVFDQIPILENNLNTAQTTLEKLPVTGRILIKDAYYDDQLRDEIEAMNEMPQLQRDLASLHTRRADASEAMLATTTVPERDSHLAYRNSIDLQIAKKEKEILIKEKQLTKARNDWAEWRILVKKDILETQTYELDKDTADGAWYFYWNRPDGSEQKQSVNRDWDAAETAKLYTSKNAMWDAYRLDAQTQLPQLNLARQLNGDHLAVLDAQEKALTARIAWLESNGSEQVMIDADKLVTQLESKRDANAYDIVIKTNPEYTSAERRKNIAAAGANLYAAQQEYRRLADLGLIDDDGPEKRVHEMVAALQQAKADGFRNPVATA